MGQAGLIHADPSILLAQRVCRIPGERCLLFQTYEQLSTPNSPGESEVFCVSCLSPQVLYKSEGNGTC